MTTLWMLVAGAGAGAGVWMIITGLRPATPTLTAVLAHLNQTPGHTTVRRVPVEERLGRRATGLVNPRRLVWRHDQLTVDLAVTDRTLTGHVGTKLAAALIGIVTVGAIGGILEFGGFAVGVVVPAWAALAAGAAGFAAPDVIVARHAARSRARLRATMTVFADIVELGLAGGYGIATAVTLAASVLDGPGGAAIRSALGDAERAGVTPWDALDDLGHQWGLVELSEAAATVSLAGGAGARIRATLTARSQSLRAAGQAELKAQARAATAQSVIPVALLAMATLALVAWPYLARLALPN